ncbi:hypothetical protein [Streptomyces shenzhenensis]|nr:hypothetical protein [Streptomyces shenzhenensis]
MAPRSGADRNLLPSGRRGRQYRYVFAGTTTTAAATATGDYVKVK